MIQINLLPWREQARQVKKMRFIIALSSSVILTFLIIVGIHAYFSRAISIQQKRNAFIQSEIDQEQAKLEKLQTLKKEHLAIESQLRLIAKWRTENFQAVRLLNELINITPRTIFITKLTRASNIVTITGKAQSNAQVTYFMKEIANTFIFKQPSLTEISKEKSNKKGEGYFQLKVEQKE